MSHYWDIECMACNLGMGDSVNRGGDVLIEAVENAWPLHLAMESGWDVTGAELFSSGSNRAAQFVGRHAPCNSFRVSSEYEYPGSSVEGRYPDVFPKVKGIDHCPCVLCADRGVVPCPACKPVRHQRLERDSEMRRKERAEKAG